MKNKILSGSKRDKTSPTPKQNKWNSAFYAKAACSKGGNYHSQYTKWRNMKIKKSPLPKSSIQPKLF